MRITPLTTSIAAQVDGVDIRKPLPEAQAEEIRQALAQHSVLVFRDQPMDLEQQSRFTEIFGPLEPLPPLKFLGANDSAVSLDVNDNARMTLTGSKKENRYRLDRREFTSEFQAWHTDSSFTAQIPRAATLRAEVVSPVGGGTTWISMAAAYDYLSPSMQTWLETLTAVHAVGAEYRTVIQLERYPAEVQARFEEEFAAREHPVVVRHPVSGRKSLFVNPTYTVAVRGLRRRESHMLLTFLFNLIATPDYAYRHRWQVGDLVVWDELATCHLAPEDFAPHPRRVVRVTAGLVTPSGAAEPKTLADAAVA
jgi:taurine dioxygenase